MAALQAIKNEPLNITYSYWDGAGHRRKISVRKGDTIEQFLGKVRDQLRPEFRELRCVALCPDHVVAWHMLFVWPGCSGGRP